MELWKGIVASAALALKHRCEKNLFLKRYAELDIRESLFSDTVGALGHLQNRIVRCSYPELIGRKIITTRPTKEPFERFPVDSKGVAYRYAEGCATRLSGKKTLAVGISNNIVAEASEQWTREFAEDTTWNVVDNIVERLSNALAVEETTRGLSLYESVADDDLAGGAALDQGNRMMDWGAFLGLHDAVRKEIGIRMFW